MNTREFFETLMEVLGFEEVEITENTNLKKIEGYDSMSIMTIIAFVDENFSRKLNAKQLASISTLKSLKELIGKDVFSD